MAGAHADSRGVVLACPQCGQANRRRYESLAQAARCGKCRMDLASLAVPVAVDSVAIFDAAIAGARIPVAVDFWAPWCGPCRAMAPELDKTALAVAGRALILKVSTDQVPELGERFRIQSIPTLVIFRDGRERTRVSGARPAPEIQRLVLEG